MTDKQAKPKKLWQNLILPLLGILLAIVIICLFFSYPFYNKILDISALANKIIVITMIITAILVVLYRIYHYYQKFKSYQKKQNNQKTYKKSTKKPLAKPNQYQLFKKVLYELYMSVLAVFFAVFLMAMTVGNLMTIYTTLFGEYKPVVTTIVVAKYHQIESKGTGYYIKTDKFDRDFRLSDDIWHSIGVGDTLEVKEKQSIFMSMIYQNELKLVNKLF